MPHDFPPPHRWFRKAKRSLHAWFCMVNGNKSALLLCLRLGRGFFLGEIVVRGERVRREHEALRGNHLRGLFALRVVHLLEERILRSEEHTSELQSHSDLVCRLLLEKKKKRKSKS